jgi:hypothetical protein
MPQRLAAVLSPVIFNSKSDVCFMTTHVTAARYINDYIIVIIIIIKSRIISSILVNAVYKVNQRLLYTILVARQLNNYFISINIDGPRIYSWWPSGHVT